MSDNKEVSLLRATDFRGKVYHRHFDHNVIIVCKHKDDNFVEYLDFQQFISGHFSMILSGIHVRCVAPEELWNMGHLQSADGTICNKYFKSVTEIFEAVGMRTLKPTNLLCDDEFMADIVSEQVPFYTLYPSMKLCQPKLNRTIEALCLEKPIDIRNPVHRLSLSGFAKKPKTLRFPVKQFLNDIPKEYVLYFALGNYRREYNYPQIIRSLYTLLKYANHKVKHKVFVALGGNYCDYNIQDEQYYHILLSSIRADFERFNILFLDRISLTDKKALLRRSSAMLYLNSSPGYNPDLRLSLSVGCPIITVKGGYSENVIMHGYSGFHLDKSDVVKLAVYMYKFIHPRKRDYHSKCARNHYIKEHTLTHYTLDTFREEDTPRPPVVQPKKDRKDTKGRSKCKVEQTEPLQPQTTIELESKKRILLYKSLSTNTLYPHMEKKKLRRRPSLPNIKIQTEIPKVEPKPVKAKSPPKSKSPPRKKQEKAKPSKPKPKTTEQVTTSSKTLLLKSKPTLKSAAMAKAPAPPPPPRPPPKIYKRKPDPPSLIRAVGAFALKREMYRPPQEDPPKDKPPKEDPPKDKPPKEEPPNAPK